MTIVSKLRYSLFLALALLFAAPGIGPVSELFGVTAAQAQTINRIAVSGNQRVDDATVISYLTVRVGGQGSRAALTASQTALLSSGLFSSASLSMSGSTLNIRVSENSIIGSVLFEGNNALSDNELNDMVDLSRRGVFTQARLETDIRTIQFAYDQRGFVGVAVTARTENSADGRIRVVFEINEGDRAGVAAINFSGNNSYDGNFLKSLITTKESHLLSWLFRDDALDEDKLAVDGEIIRQYYVNHGYPDAQILSAVSEFDAAQNAYFVTFTISEGERYSFGGIGIETSIVGLDTEALKSVVRTYEGDTFSARNIAATSEEMAVRAAGQGYAFADVRARLNRDIVNRTFTVTYLVDEGARIYVERINITGNDKTRDFVIRRELDFAEGDPFNRSIITRGKSNIEALGFFSVVNISTSPGSAPDKIVIDIAVQEQSTGDYGATIGYESTQGILGELTLTESNFLGRGQYLKVAIGATQSGRTFDFSFTEPRFMGMKISTGIDLYKRISDETASSFYGSDTTGGQFRIGVPLSNEIDTTFFVGGDVTTFKDSNPTDSAFAINGVTRSKAYLGYTVAYNTIDDVNRPTSGFIGNITQQYVGLDNSFFKTEARGRYFFPLNEEYRIVASVRGQAGIINDVSGTGVHPTESFMLGSKLVRGFQGAGMGGRAANGQALGATSYAGLSAELEFPIPAVPPSYGLRAAVWADAGWVGAPSAAAPAAASGTAQPIRASVGASIIWESPFGPLRGDFAHVVQKDTGDLTQVFGITINSLL